MVLAVKGGYNCFLTETHVELDWHRVFTAGHLDIFGNDVDAGLGLVAVGDGNQESSHNVDEFPNVTGIRNHKVTATSAFFAQFRQFGRSIVSDGTGVDGDLHLVGTWKNWIDPVATVFTVGHQHDLTSDDSVAFEQIESSFKASPNVGSTIGNNLVDFIFQILLSNVISNLLV